MINRTIAPPTKEIDAVNFLPAEVSILPNGTRLHKMASHTQPIVRLEIVLKAGKWDEPAEGASHILSKMLLEGTSHYTSKQLAEIIAYYGASLECQQGYDRLTLTLYCLSKFAPQLLPIVQEVLLAPAFPEEEFSLLQKRTIQNISVEKKKNSYLATELFTKNIYGDGHPYNSGIDEQAIRRLSTQTIRAFHQEAIQVNEAEVFLCGDISDDLQKSVEAVFQWHSGVDLKKKAAVHSIKEQSPETDFIRVKDSLQSSIRVGCIWPMMNHPDYNKLTVLNKVLGGYFGSRLMKNIREDKGFTYGIHATLSPKEKSNIFSIGTDVNYKSTEATLREIYKEINILKESLIPEDELETVKKYTIGKFLGDINTIFEQCDRYKTLVLHGLGADYYTRLLQDVRTVTAEELLSLSRVYWEKGVLREACAGRR